MDKGLSRGMRPDVTKWDDKRTTYKCADGVDVLVPKGAFRRDGEEAYSKIKYANAIVYKIDEGGDVSPFVSWTEFNRDASVIVDGAEDVTTVTFPRTVREVLNSAFAKVAIRSVVLNEGLEELGKCDDVNFGVFYNARLRKVQLPSTLRVLNDKVFGHCEQLRRVTFTSGSKLERIGKWCFSRSGLEEFVAPQSLREICGAAFYKCNDLKRVLLNEGLEKLKECRDDPLYYHGVFEDARLAEIALPSTLEDVDCHAFKGCESLRKVYVENGYSASISFVFDLPSAQIGPPPDTLAGSARVWDLRE